jgi:hypothetical protein
MAKLPWWCNQVELKPSGEKKIIQVSDCCGTSLNTTGHPEVAFWCNACGKNCKKVPQEISRYLNVTVKLSRLWIWWEAFKALMNVRIHIKLNWRALGW